VSPVRGDIVVEAVATGSVVPRRRVELKSRVTGVVEEVLVEPGDEIAAGDRVAHVLGVADPAGLAAARSEAREAQIALDSARADLSRTRALFDQRAISAGDLDRAETGARLADERYRLASEQVRILTDGGAKDQRAGEIRSTLAGTVLAVEVTPGSSVIEAGPFGAGTTVARVADMTDLIFEGHLSEIDVDLVRPGMPLKLEVGARLSPLDDPFERVSPEGTLIDGAVRFAVRGTVFLEQGQLVRANTSAIARIVVDERRDVVTVDRGAVRVTGDRMTVDVQVAVGRFEARPVRLGVSDGLVVEVIDGLTVDDRIRPLVAGGL
jgi:HlyD family secretion protein